MTPFRFAFQALTLAFSTALISTSVSAGTTLQKEQLVREAGLARCVEKEATKQSRHSQCLFARTADSREVALDFLTFQGSLPETAADHGKLLAKEMDDGLIRFVLDSRARFKAGLPPIQQRLFDGLYQCIFDRMKSSLDPEFQLVHKNLAAGLRDGGVTRYSDDDVLAMSLATEMASLFSGLQRRIQKNPTVIVTELLPQCGGYFLGDTQSIESLFHGQDLRSAFMNLGCTGVASPPDASGDTLWMSRNLDGSAIGPFNRHPVVIAHDPTASIPGTYRYLGVAAAGLHYAGGNAGFNEVGIGVTLHEMETEKYLSKLKRGSGLTAVYLQNRVLERASSIDEAWKIVKNTGTFTAWTMVVGDAKTGEVAAFEFTGRKAVIAKRSQAKAHFQANRFLSPQMQDQFYNYSYNKVLESRFRLARLTTLAESAQGALDDSFMLNALSDHVDQYQGPRSFGRNLIKTNTMMTQIFAPARGEMITSLGDRYPVGQGRFLAFKVDFETLATGSAFQLLDTRRSENPSTWQRPQYSKALESYVRSYLSYKEGPADISHLGEVKQLLADAIFQAAKEGIDDFAFDYMAAKLDLKLSGRLAESNRLPEALETLLAARQRLQGLMAGWQIGIDAPQKGLHPYDETLVLVALAQTEMLLEQLDAPEPTGVLANSPSVSRYVQMALERIDKLLAEETQRYELQSLRRKLVDGWGQLRPFGPERASSLGLDFVTVE